MTADPDAFRTTLRRWREARRWSQGHLARVARLDTSLVNRLESGQRPPTRDAIAKLAAALDMPGLRDELLVFAGFLPESPAAVLRAEPIASDLYTALTDPATPAAVRELLRQQVAGVLALARCVTPTKGAHP